MNVIEIYKQYPNALPILKVGDKFFLNHAKSEAEKEATEKGLKVEIVKKPSKKRLNDAS